uniref:ARAD1C06204p n=1 Tax=Blastobotrys adeninivorans TaxID=409370 RepID=A0A060T4T5_BLAAD
MQTIWLERAHYGHFFYRIPNGESAADVYDRTAGFNETLFRQFSSDKFPSVLVLVTHGIFARVFLMKWYRWTYEQFENLKNIPHCQFIIMEKDEQTQKYQLITRLRKWSDDREREDPDEDAHLSQDDLPEAEVYSSLSHQKRRALRAKERQIRAKSARALTD